MIVQLQAAHYIHRGSSYHQEPLRLNKSLIKLDCTRAPFGKAQDKLPMKLNNE